MASTLNQIRDAFKALPLTSDPTFHSLVTEGRLQYSGADGKSDLIDEISARVVCGALSSKTAAPILVVLPDKQDRRSPLLFSTAIVLQALHNKSSTNTDRPILYVSNHIGIRKQLSNVRIGSLNLDCVFRQYNATRNYEEIDLKRSINQQPKVIVIPKWAASLWKNLQPDGRSFPSVHCVYAPSDPAKILLEQPPLLVAVDLDDTKRPLWLSPLIKAAILKNIPVIGWTAIPFSESSQVWVENGGALFKWPRLSRNSPRRIETIHQFNDSLLKVEVKPLVMLGEQVIEISTEFATAADKLLEAREFQNSRLFNDAIMLGWKYLRTLESVPVPLEVWERESELYWGTRKLSELRDDFVRFIDAISPSSKKLHALLQKVAESLSVAHDRLTKSGAPLWLCLANLCVDSDHRRKILFYSKSRKEMFAFWLLANFNIGEKDLKDVGIRLGYLKERLDESEDFEELGDLSITEIPLLVGLPSQFAEKSIESVFQSGSVEILIWPHQEAILGRRAQHLSSELRFSSKNLNSISPGFENDFLSLFVDGKAPSAGLSLTTSSHVAVGALGSDLRQRSENAAFWKRQDASNLVSNLFGTSPSIEEEELESPVQILDESSSDEVEPKTAWVQEAIELHLEGGHCLLFPIDEKVNVIVRKSGGTEVNQRYVRSLRLGDEILYIQGQRHQSLYDLLISRVHRDPIISQYLGLVRRWQEDLVKAFGEAEQKRKMNCEWLLKELQEKGSKLSSPQTIKYWLNRFVLAPNDVDDLRRTAEILSISFAKEFYVQIHRAARQLKGLHISLSTRLNRWLASDQAGAVAAGKSSDVIDEALGLTVEDFQHSLLRFRVIDVNKRIGPFYRAHLGRLEEVNLDINKL